MKAILFIIAFLVAIPAQAQDAHVCSLQGSIYETATHYRDAGMSPQEALKGVAAYSEIPLQFRKDAINAVYFDRALSDLHGAGITQAYERICLKNFKPFEALK